MARSRSIGRAILVFIGTALWWVGPSRASGGWSLPPSSAVEWIAVGGTLPNGYSVVIRGRSGDSQTGPVPRSPIYVPYLISHTGASLAAACVAVRVETPPPALYAAELAWAEEVWNQLATVRRCLATPPGKPPSVSNWTEIVREYLPLPTIAPDPSRGVVNVPEYLTISGALYRQFVAATNLGPLTIDATGTINVRVNGTSLGWFDTLGGAWPYGQIQFRPTAPGYYELGTTESWTGSFFLDGNRYTLPPVSVSSPASRLQVSQLTSFLQSAS